MEEDSEQGSKKRKSDGGIDDTLRKATATSDNETDDTTEPNIQPRVNASQLPTPLISRPPSSGRSIEILEGGSGVSVDLDVKDGEYVVKIIKKRRVTSTSSDEEHNVEDTKQLAQSAGMLFLQADILRDIGDQLLAQYRASLQHLINFTNHY